ncbi:MAG: translocation/assembly module TamB domain-containing protein, partial [Moheibacter sp.]
PEKLDISANAKVNDGSDFTINTGATKVEGSSSLVRFIPEGEDKENEEGGPKGMLIDLNISADSNTTVNLVFDPITKDMVTANGSTEDLKFHLGRTGNMTLEGTYTLESGKYQFRQVPLLNRDFDIKPGSFVSWNGGSPLDANMHITANFERTVSNVGEYLGTGYSQTYSVILGIIISESLSNPKMDFTMTIPKGGTDMQSLIDYKFNLDPDDKMIQFGSILLLGQFMTSERNAFAAGAASAGAGIALKQLGGVINSLIAGGGVMIDMDYVQGSEMSNTSNRFKTDLHVNLSPRWTFNGEVGVPVGSGYTNETATGEAEVQWDVSKKMDKSLVVNFFTRPTNFGVQNFGGAGNFQSFGAGIMYKTTFDRFSEIFKKDSPEVKIKSTADQPSFFERTEQQDQGGQEPEVQEQKMDEKTDSVDQKPISKTKPPKKQKGGSLVRFK